MSLLILGGAGCGKTTVALYRMAALNFKNKTKYKPQAMLVVVPEEGLVRLSLKQLRSLGLEGTEVTIDKWIEQQARRLFKRLPKKFINTHLHVSYGLRDTLQSDSPTINAHSVKRNIPKLRYRLPPQM